MSETGSRNISHVDPGVERTGATRRGLVIGIGTYLEAGVPDIPSARADAEAIFALMTDPDCGLFEEANVTLLVDEEATRAGIEEAMEDLRIRAGAGDDVWLYFAGHGLPESGDDGIAAQQGTILSTYGFKPSRPMATGISAQVLNSYVRDLDVRTSVRFFDCCHAAGLVPGGTRELPREVFEGFGGEGSVSFFAARAVEQAGDVAGREHGAFTACLLEGLAGAADRNQDGRVDTSELWAYLVEQVPERARRQGHSQRPVRESLVSAAIPLTQTRRLTKLDRHLRELFSQNRLTVAEVDLALRLLHSRPTETDRTLVRERILDLEDARDAEHEAKLIAKMKNALARLVETRPLPQKRENTTVERPRSMPSQENREPERSDKGMWITVALATLLLLGIIIAVSSLS
ncbi:MAG: caspase family protein [Pseudomonadota bacterium]